MKVYRKISVLALAALVVTTGFTSCSEDDLDTNQYNKSGVNILGFGPMPITRGETMRVTGTQLNNVREVLFPEGNQKLTPSTTYIAGEFSLTNSEEMTVTIPDQCVPGKLRLLLNNGDTVVSKSNITFSEEIKVSSFAPASLHPGDVLTIKGEYVWNIGQVMFFDHVTVDAEAFIKNTRNEIQVRVPMEAKSGELAYNDGSDGAENFTIGNLSVDAAKATGISNATPEFGETVTITGENLDLVTTIDFPAVKDVTFTSAADGKSISVSVPATTISGTITMTAASGLTTSVDITMPLATVTATAPTKDVKEGQTVTIKGTNLDRITQLILPAIKEPLEKGSFTQSATEISFVVPEKMGDGTVILVQHENYSIESDKISMYSEDPVETLWSGNLDIDWNVGGCLQTMAYGAFDWSTVEAGTKLYITYEKKTPGDSNWGCLSLRHGIEWGALPGNFGWQYDFPDDGGVYTVTLTQDVLDDLIANGGLIITGFNFVITKVARSIPENVIWKGSLDIDWNVGGCLQTMAYGAYDWSTVKAGTKLCLTYEKKTPGDSNWGCLSLRHGIEWGALPGNLGWQYDFPSDEGLYEVQLTQDAIDDFIANGGLIITGFNFILKKVVMK